MRGIIQTVPAAYVLYWMQVNRRAESNRALAFAVARANEIRLPLLVYEGLSCTYPYASDRFHTFVLEAVPETSRRLAKRGIGYVFHMGEPAEALPRLTARAALVVTDDYPHLPTPYTAIDSSCIVPMRLFEKKEYGAYTLRPKLHRLLPQHLKPVERVEVKKRFRESVELHTEVTDANIPSLVASCEIDHFVKPVPSFRGGRLGAEAQLRNFLERDLEGQSHLSPWLHFGHISSLEVALAVQLHAAERGLNAAAFLEQLIVRRELAFNHMLHAADPMALLNVPNWAQETLRKHDADPRPWTYTREQFEQAQTHDALWNAAQKEMLLRGKIHGYYRMYWGKKIMEWSPTHQEALDTMIYLHDRWALDGRDPNTYANILWCFGLHDRPWGERPIFGMTRYMTLEGCRRKTDVTGYLREIAELEQS